MNPVRCHIVLYCLLLSVQLSAQAPAKLVLPLLFTDNMVLQREVNIPVWGNCLPHGKVTAVLNGYTARALADSTGKWKLYLPALPAGGPFQLHLNAGAITKIINNVMIGEVWLASGQSNMNYRLKDESIAKCDSARFPAIREFHVPENVHQLPQQTLKGGEWKICTPENARQFSAVAYSFAKQLHLDKKVAVGIIHASRGGTMIETWLSEEAMLTHPAYRQSVLQRQAQPEDWENNQRIFDSANLVRTEVIRTAHNGLLQQVHTNQYTETAEWRKAVYPLAASEMKARPYNFIWLRKAFELKEVDPHKTYTLKLGQVVSNAEVAYLNGVEIGKGAATGTRNHTIPAGLLKNGHNLLAVRFLSEYGSGKIGRAGDEPGVYDAGGASVTMLKEDWLYNLDIEPEMPYFKSYNKEPGIFYNGMIAPLVPYAIKGVLWYQGENNSVNAPLYQSLLPLLLNDWRTRSQNGYMPFLVVQLPGYKYASTWPVLREAQLSVLDQPATGLVVTIDVGNPEDVHPSHKEIVGQRLYKAAKHVAYGDSLVYSGPIYKNYEISGNAIIVHFDHVGSGLKAGGSNILKGFEIAGDDKKFLPAEASIQGNAIIVKNMMVQKPVAIRYAWAQNPECNLYNAEGLPASPFRTDHW